MVETVEVWMAQVQTEQEMVAKVLYHAVGAIIQPD
jgi:hypothetical protein